MSPRFYSARSEPRSSSPAVSYRIEQIMETEEQEEQEEQKEQEQEQQKEQEREENNSFSVSDISKGKLKKSSGGSEINGNSRDPEINQNPLDYHEEDNIEHGKLQNGVKDSRDTADADWRLDNQFSKKEEHKGESETNKNKKTIAHGEKGIKGEPERKRYDDSMNPFMDEFED